MINKSGSNVDGSSEEDAAKRQQRLGKNIVRLSMFLLGLVVLGQLNILSGQALGVLVVFGIFSLLFGGPLLLGMIVVYLFGRSRLQR